MKKYLKRLCWFIKLMYPVLFGMMLGIWTYLGHTELLANAHLLLSASLNFGGIILTFTSISIVIVYSLSKRELEWIRRKNSRILDEFKLYVGNNFYSAIGLCVASISCMLSLDGQGGGLTAFNVSMWSGLLTTSFFFLFQLLNLILFSFLITERELEKG